MILFKNLPGRRTGSWPQKITWAITLARNALVVIIGTVIAYIFYTNNKEPFKLTGKSNMILKKLYHKYLILY